MNARWTRLCLGAAWAVLVAAPASARGGEAGRAAARTRPPLSAARAKRDVMPAEAIPPSPATAPLSDPLWQLWSRLTADSALSGNGLALTVSGNVVTVSGVVESEADKTRALDRLRSQAGTQFRIESALQVVAPSAPPVAASGPSSSTP